MTDLKRLLQLPARERWLLIQSAMLLLLIRAGGLEDLSRYVPMRPAGNRF
jgi:hypothetical protein